MPELPDPRSLSPESLELLRSLVVRAVIDLDLSQVDASTYYGVSTHSISEWVNRYREQGEAALEVKAQGRPQGAGRALSPDQEDEIRTLVVASTPPTAADRLGDVDTASGGRADRVALGHRVNLARGWQVSASLGANTAKASATSA